MVTIIPQWESTAIVSLWRARNYRPGLLPLTYECSHALSHHQHGRVYRSTYQVGHDRGVYHSQPLQAMHLAVLIDHRHGVRPWPHLARARDVRIRGDLAQQPVVKGRIRGQIGSSRLKAWSN